MIFTELRKEKYRTQQSLADAVGVKQATVAMWETGKAVPSMKNLLKLSEIMETDWKVLYTSFQKQKGETQP